jgi:hypothetical protein
LRGESEHHPDVRALLRGVEEPGAFVAELFGQRDVIR